MTEPSSQFSRYNKLSCMQQQGATTRMLDQGAKALA